MKCVGNYYLVPALEWERISLGGKWGKVPVHLLRAEVALDPPAHTILCPQFSQAPDKLRIHRHIRACKDRRRDPSSTPTVLCPKIRVGFVSCEVTQDPMLSGPPLANGLLPLC